MAELQNNMRVDIGRNYVTIFPHGTKNNPIQITKISGSKLWQLSLSWVYLTTEQQSMEFSKAVRFAGKVARQLATCPLTRCVAHSVKLYIENEFRDFNPEQRVVEDE